MLAAYAEVIDTLGFVLACISLGLTWWFRQKEPQHQVAIRKELKRADRLDELHPRLRSSITSSLQFLEAEPRWPIEKMAWKESGRLESVREAWAEVRPVAGTPLLSEYGKLGVDAAIDWLRSGSWPAPKAS